MAATALFRFRIFYLLVSLSGKEIFVCFPYIRPTDWAKEEYGAPSGTRTRDPLIKSQLLYQLS